MLFLFYNSWWLKLLDALAQFFHVFFQYLWMDLFTEVQEIWMLLGGALTLNQAVWIDTFKLVLLVNNINKTVGICRLLLFIRFFDGIMISLNVYWRPLLICWHELTLSYRSQIHWLLYRCSLVLVCCQNISLIIEVFVYVICVVLGKWLTRYCILSPFLNGRCHISPLLEPFLWGMCTLSRSTNMFLCILLIN